jgi:amino acid permease
MIKNRQYNDKKTDNTMKKKKEKKIKKKKKKQRKKKEKKKKKKKKTTKKLPLISILLSSWLLIKLESNADTEKYFFSHLFRELEITNL